MVERVGEFQGSVFRIELSSTLELLYRNKIMAHI